MRLKHRRPEKPNLAKWWLGSFYFCLSYFAKRGFLDGRAGWTFARLKMRYFDEIRLKILEKQKEHSTEGKKSRS